MGELHRHRKGRKIYKLFGLNSGWMETMYLTVGILEIE